MLTCVGAVFFVGVVVVLGVTVQTDVLLRFTTTFDLKSCWKKTVGLDGTCGPLAAIKDWSALLGIAKYEVTFDTLKGLSKTIIIFPLEEVHVALKNLLTAFFPGIAFAVAVYCAKRVSKIFSFEAKLTSFTLPVYPIMIVAPTMPDEVSLKPTAALTRN